MRGWLFAIVIVEVALVAVGILAASQQMDLPGVTAVHAHSGRVFVGVAHQVFITDESGFGIGKLDWSFGRATSIATDAQGRIVVADGERGEVLRFSSDGSGGVRLPMSRKPQFNFKVVPLPDDKLAVAATMDHAVFVVDSTGTVIAEQKVRYPNGLDVLMTEGRPTILVVETGSRRLHAFDTKLQVVTSEAVETARRMVAPLDPEKRPQLLDGILNARGEYEIAVCRDTQGDCALMRPTKNGHEVLAELARVSANEDVADPLLLLISDSVHLSNGSLLVASPRLARPFLFSGTATTGFSMDAVTSEVSVEAVEATGAVVNGLSVSVFGDSQMRARYAGQHGARRAYAVMERVTRLSTIAILSVLLLLLLTRRLGLDATQSRANELWARLFRPDLPNLLSAAALTVLAGAAGSLPGILLGSASIAIGGASVAAFIAGAKWIGPRVMRGRAPAIAESVFALFVNPTAKLQWARFMPAEDDAASEALDLLESFDRSGALDLVDAFDVLFPRMTLVARTDQHVYCVEVGLLGLPTGPVARWEILPNEASSKTSLPVPRRAVSVAVPSSLLNGAREGSRELTCHLCRKPFPCSHSESSIAVAAPASILLPGLGHLLQGRFGRARTLGVLALAVALDAFQNFMPQYLGTLPSDPGKYQWPAVMFSALVFVALVDVTFEAMRRRALLAKPAARPEMT